MRSQSLSGRRHSELLIRVATSGRSVVIMRVCLRLVVLPFLFLAAILVRVRDAGVIVVVLVVARLVLELGDRTTDVVMRHVPVVVAMDFAWMLVLVFRVARDVLSNASGHEYLLSGAPAGALRLADVGSRCFALGRGGLALRSYDLAAALHAAARADRAQRARGLGDVVLGRDLDPVLARGRADLASRALLRGRRLECGLVEARHG